MLAGLDDLLRGQVRTNAGLNQLLGDLGIERNADGQLPDRIPLNHYATLLEMAAEQTGDTCFGLSFATAYPFGSSGIVGYIFGNAPDLHAMIKCIGRYAKLRVDDFNLDFEEREQQAILTWRFGDGLKVPHKQLLEFVMALFVVRVRRLVGQDWSVHRALFAYADPRRTERQHQRYQEFFGRKLLFRANRNSLSAPSASFMRRASNADSMLYGHLIKIAEEQLARHRGSGEIVDRLSAYLVANIATHGAGLDAAAAALGMDKSRLQSDLRRKRTNFEREVAGVRQRLAEEYLKNEDDNLTMTEIAMLLGFSELSAFTHAARRWFGMSPTEKRQQLRARRSAIT